MLDVKRVTIAGQEYALKGLGSKEGLKVLARITKILGPAFGAAFKTLKSDDQVTLGALGAEGIGELITKLSELATPDELADLTHVFMGQTLWIKDGKAEIPLRSVYDSHFAGDYGALFGLLVEHINLNFASFIAGLGLTAPQS